ncbi:hypothetical protein [Streptomyces sp. NPDC056244]|uniref:hypothetical protein n=1 Tax=unclassified Streptomyces TaxID=2593676 RepID=UPI0035D73951
MLFAGLTGVYLSEFFASFGIGSRVRAVGTANERLPAPHNPGERALGAFHILTGLWLMYLTFATTLNISLNCSLPAG